MNDMNYCLITALICVSIAFVATVFRKRHVKQLTTLLGDVRKAIAPVTLESFTPVILEMYNTMLIHPDDWLVDDFYMWHKDPNKNFPSLWIANGIDHCNNDHVGRDRHGRIADRDTRLNWYDRVLMFRMSRILKERQRLGVKNIITGYTDA